LPGYAGIHLTARETGSPGLAPYNSTESKCPKLPRSKDQWGGSNGDTTGSDSDQIHHLGSNVAE
jgi:hypothetical protein